MLVLLLGHLGSARVSLDLKATCQERTRWLFTIWSAIYVWGKMAVFSCSEALRTSGQITALEQLRWPLVRYLLFN